MTPIITLCAGRLTACHDALVRTVLLIVLLTGGSAPLFAQGQAAEVTTLDGEFSIRPPIGGSLIEFAGPPFAVDVAEELGTPSPGDGIAHGLHAFANETGRFRAFAKTGIDSSPVSGATRYVYEQTFRRTSTVAPTISIIKSWVEVFLEGVLSEFEIIPTARILVKVDVYQTDATWLLPMWSRFLDGAKPVRMPQLDQIVQVGVNQQTLEVTRPSRPELVELSGSRLGIEVLNGPLPTTVVANGTGGRIHVDIEATREALELGDVDVDEVYTLVYYVEVWAADGVGESRSEAFFGDPVDVDSGLTLETEDAPTVPAKPPRLCDVEFDEQRYRHDPDGTVIDAYTGLMWQRCPLGFTLNDGGTPSDVTDDRCANGGDFEFTWQEALQAAAANSMAGRTDWRVPNIKELDSLVEPACRSPALEPAAFPDTPQRFFWSSTPDADPDTNGTAARGVSFLVGTLVAQNKARAAPVRLVRTGDEPPIRPLPAISVAGARIVEGDIGNDSLSIPIVLDRPSDTDASVQFRTLDHTARAGEDYVATSGTVVIPAGATSADVVVPIVGDALGEPNEAFFLALHSPSANARLIGSVALGQIEDDEPIVDLAPADAVEGNTGRSELVFTVTLSEPAQTDTSLSFTTADGTATSGSDYVATSGTLAIPGGQTFAQVTVPILGDTSREGDESFLLTLSNPSPNVKLGLASATAIVIDDDDAATLRALNDTGVDYCVDTVSGRQCSGQVTVDFPGQDGQFGRDVTNNVPGDGVKGFSFTKLDASGAPLPNQAAQFSVTPWDCVRDEVTGLLWEVKTDDGGLRDKDSTYSWLNSSGINDGGSAGTANGGVCTDAGNCDTEKYVAQVNAAGLCGRSDWRMPSREELQSIIDHGNPAAPAYDTAFFANSAGPASYWTATPSAGSSVDAWSVTNVRGTARSTDDKNLPLKARLVTADD